MEELVFFATFRNSPSSEQHIPIVNMILFWLDLENISNKNTKIDSALDVFFEGGTFKSSPGLVFSDAKDLRYTSSVRMVSARMWDVSRLEEGDR